MQTLDNLSQYDIVLASRSPRRETLLSSFNVPFRILTIDDIDESFPEGLTPNEVARYISSHKAEAYRKLLTPPMLVITADTIVSCDGRILGKPKDRDEAVEMLTMMSGRTHQVVTGVTVMTQARTETIDVTTHVTFSPLLNYEIRYYIDRYKPYDKAGAYGIQEWIGQRAVERIEGSYTNVMGLPTSQLCQLLQTF
ncbi:MAG: septum formation protein Maf [Bacteroidaceae bacterium]|nr:septum formation protein Maf [Bacteroidaceae bacterium]